MHAHTQTSVLHLFRQIVGSNDSRHVQLQASFLSLRPLYRLFTLLQVQVAVVLARELTDLNDEVTQVLLELWYVLVEADQTFDEHFHLSTTQFTNILARCRPAVFKLGSADQRGSATGSQGVHERILKSSHCLQFLTILQYCSMKAPTLPASHNCCRQVRKSQNTSG